VLEAEQGRLAQRRLVLDAVLDEARLLGVGVGRRPLGGDVLLDFLEVVAVVGRVVRTHGDSPADTAGSCDPRDVITVLMSSTPTIA
jgi:hypothetical protein